MADNRKLAIGLQNFTPAAREDMALRAKDLERGKTAELLRRAGQEMYDNPVVNTAISFTPGAGDLQSGYEALKSAKEGDWTNAGLNAVGVLPFVPALAGTFIGKGAKTWDSVQAAEALKRIDAGEDAAKVWKETGYAVAPWDKQMRTEIPDALSQRVNPIKENKPAGWYPSLIGEYTNHPQLFEAYPDSKHIKIDTEKVYEIDPFGGAKGAYSHDENMLYMQPRGDEGYSTAIHELQHAVQAREGFARGGSPAGVARNFMAYANPEWVDYAKSLPAYENQATPEAKKEFVESFVKMRLGHPEDAYNRLSGEAEARLTQARMNMTPEERLAQYPFEPEYFEQATGVPIDQLITRFDNGQPVGMFGGGK